MCGIFGVIGFKDGEISNALLENVVSNLAILSESRGKESSGFASFAPAAGHIHVIKGAVPVSTMLRTDEYRAFIGDGQGRPTDTANSERFANIFAVMGHSRLVTNGSMLRDENNQPVIRDGLVGVHNGIIVNDDLLWEKYEGLCRRYDIDTEVMLAIIREKIHGGLEIATAVSQTVEEVFGTVSLALMFDDRAQCVITTNNGSLYCIIAPGRLFLFASEHYILKKAVENTELDSILPGIQVLQVRPNTGVLINIQEVSSKTFTYGSALPEPSSNGLHFSEPLALFCKSIKPPAGKFETLKHISAIHINPRAASERKLLEHNWDRIGNLRRCKRCLLPETFPFLTFDDNGVCNICNNYKPKNQPKPMEELFALVEPYRSKTGNPDCIVPYSGGRDSTYTLHIVKNVLKLHPIAFTYDWGMVTDLGRRNIARVCGRLGVENIVVSADIQQKRSNIRKNILAWLKRPDLGMVPLFMAGDKYFFYYTDKVKKQTGINLNIWGISPLENTDFKVGFCGVPPSFNKERIYSLPLISKMMLFRHILKNILVNPAYLNESIMDTMGSFAARYITRRSCYYHMFDYYCWDETEIADMIINEYEWETAIDTRTTWRIGDGTAGFYNYVYFNVAGFSEHDTFRSNQIREGMITREEGLRLIEDENLPRYENIKWYFDIVGLDYESTIKRVNAIPKLY